MLIEINTGSTIEGSERMENYFSENIQNALKKFEEKVTRIEVHVVDENAGKGGDRDKRCTMEARPAGFKPIGIVHHAATVEDAVKGATDKIKHALEHTFGKLQSH